MNLKMSTTKLKIIALICMVIDHMWWFIPNMPLWFYWIGRISAPIFFFCMAWGFHFTRNRKRYLLRFYFCGIIMSLVNSLINHFSSNTYISIENNIFVNLLIAGVLIWILEVYRTDIKKGRYYLFLFLIEQIISTVLIIAYSLLFNSSYLNLEDVFVALFGNIFMCNGGIAFAILPVILYFSKDSKRKIILSYTGFCLFYTLFYVTDFVARICMYIELMLPYSLYIVTTFIVGLLGIESIPTYHVPFYTLLRDQWIMIFALPFFILYNGSKGKGFKYFFYMFYPLHIYLLYIIGNIIYRKL